MSIDLTPDQQQQLDRTDERPARVRDPRTQTDYVLIPTEGYEHIREVLEDDADQHSLRRQGLGEAALVRFTSRRKTGIAPSNLRKEEVNELKHGNLSMRPCGLSPPGRA